MATKPSGKQVKIYQNRHGSLKGRKLQQYDARIRGMSSARSRELKYGKRNALNHIGLP